MCIQLPREYTECGHCVTIITKCPTYYKQQSSARSIFSFFFGKREKAKHCGRLVPHQACMKEPFCESCLLKKSQGLKGKKVGHGAVLIERQTIDEDFARTDRKRPNKESRRKHSGKDHESSDKIHRKKHEVPNCKASVWLPDVYHNPEKFAKREVYRRAPAEAPPVSPPKTSKSTHPRSTTTQKKSSSRKAKKDPRSKHHQDHSEDSYEYRSYEGAKRMPVFGNIPPLIKPLEPTHGHQYRGHFAAPAETPLPPAAARLSPRSRRQAAAISSPYMARGSGFGQPVAPTTITATRKEPRLKRKPATTYLNIRDQPIHTIPAQIPEYQVYLNAMAASPRMVTEEEQHPPAARRTRSSRRGREETVREQQHPPLHPKRLALVNFGKAMGIESSLSRSPFLTDDDGSDVSFVCSDSRRLTDTGRRIA